MDFDKLTVGKGLSGHELRQESSAKTAANHGCDLRHGRDKCGWLEQEIVFGKEAIDHFIADTFSVHGDEGPGDDFLRCIRSCRIVFEGKGGWNDQNIGTGQEGLNR